MNDKVQQGVNVPAPERGPAEPAAPAAVDIALQGRRKGPRTPLRSLLLAGTTLALFLAPPTLLGYIFEDSWFVLAVVVGMVLGLLLVMIFLALTQGVFTWQWVAMKPLRALAAGRLIEAEQYFDEAQEYGRRFGAHDHRRGFMLRTFGDFRNFQGRFAEAKAFYLEALEIQKKNLPQRPADYCDTLNNCSLLYQFQEDFASAESMLEQGVSVIRSFSWSVDFAAAEMNLLYNLAHACTRQEKFARALEVLEEMQRPEPARDAKSYRDHYLAQRAVLAVQQGRFADALSACRQVRLENSRLAALTLAEAHLGLGQYHEAEKLLRGYLEIWEKQAGVRFGRPLLLMGRSLLLQGQVQSALGYLERTRRLYQSQGMLGLPSWSEALNDWARILDEQGQQKLAAELRSEAELLLQAPPETAIKQLPS